MPESIYKLIRVTGSDAGEFLQGQLSQDIEFVDQKGSLPAAWCNPKGRVISVTRILTIDGGYGVVVPDSLAESLCERLAVYRLRADVDLGVTGADWVCLVIDADRRPGRLEELGLIPQQKMNDCRIANGLTAVNIGIGEQCIELMGFTRDFKSSGIDLANAATADYLRAAKIRAGIPEILARHTEKFTAHMLNLDLLGAISFDKGCYTGQEVIARTQNLGSSKRRLMRYRTDTGLRSGDRISHEGRAVGEVLNVSGVDLLAVTPLELHEQILYADDAEIVPASMPYGTTD